ncbi:hypothetical protein ALC57_14105 [Trachymyrmex cornetzi]|uniref:Uncharacterized protein n=1 Tax=Trachymyrmex cornetzi TaxID=471704 RepID=A0A151IYS5_9HYME|nr:hypothetical protein ALC57_14105 [Trachymyrmex cornetzi]
MGSPLSPGDGARSTHIERRAFVSLALCSCSSPWSLPVSSFVGLARCFGNTRPVAHARPGKDPRVTLAVVVELIRGKKKSRGSAAGKAGAFDQRA